MPELPEVETVVRDLRPRLIGRRIAALSISRKTLRRKWSPEWKRALLGRRFEAIARRGKWILLELDGPWLLVHLGMTGQFVVVPAAASRENHTHLICTLDDGVSELRFRDIRRFGSVTLYPSRSELEAFFEASRLGPEPFDVEAAPWRRSFAKTRRNLKAILLDQRLVAGIGNIYADESCFEAKLHPTMLGSELTRRECDRLREAIVVVLRRAIERRGSSIRNYVGGSGLQGAYQNEFRAYGRAGQPCPRCGAPIERIVLAGRATHYCPRCQKRRVRSTR